MPVFTTYLSPEEYGIQNYYFVITLYITQFSLLAINAYVIRYYFLIKEDRSRKKMISESLYFSLINASFVNLIAFFLIPVVFKYTQVEIPVKPFLVFYLLNCFFDVFTIFPLILYRVREAAFKFVFLSISKILVRYVFAYIILAHLNGTLLNKIQSDLVVNIIYAVISLSVMRKELIWTPFWKNLIEKLKFSLPYLASGIMFLLVDNSDRFFLEREVTIAELGVFSIAATITGAFASFVSSIFRAVEPSIYRVATDGDLSAYLTKVRKGYYFIVFIAAFSLALFVEPVISIMANERFLSAAQMAPPLIFGTLFQSVTFIYAIVFAIVLKTRHVFLQNLLGVTVVLVCNSLLIPLFQTWGAGFSRTISFAVMALYGIFFTQRYVSLSRKDDIVFFTITIVSAAVVYYLIYKFQFENELLFTLIKIGVILGSAVLLKSFLNLRFRRNK